MRNNYNHGILAFCFFLLLSTQSAQAESVMYGHFIDVGQADATLLEFSCGAVLIDAGAQDSAHVNSLLTYLRDFFNRRQDLNNTLESIIVTHPHIDHTRALREVVEAFTVRRYIDTGASTGSGAGDPNWVRQNAQTRNIRLREILDSEITALSSKTGLSDADIDPVACQDIDPAIRILSGRLNENPGWAHGEFDNKNNHSIVTRIDFGRASFLFTGDLEEPAIETLLDYYAGTPMLNIDVYQVGHHGSHNGTTAPLLQAMSPKIAVFSMGSWDFGRGSRNRFTTWRYGHPRKAVVDLLEKNIPRRRSRPVEVAVAEGSQHFVRYTVRRAIYGTGWYGTVKVRATNKGRYRVTE